MHASEFLKTAQTDSVPACVVLYGDQRFLKLASLELITRRVLGDEDEFGPSRFDDPLGDLKFSDVVAELTTKSMWGEKRLVIVDDAEKFVSNHRAALEKYVNNPSDAGVLALVLGKWPSNTKLYKMLAKSGLPIECNVPKAAELKNWIHRTIHDAGKTIDRDALELLIELSGHDMGLLDRELAKLIDFLGERSAISREDVVKLVGGWKADTTFRMLRFLRSGNTSDALRELEYLIRAGEDPHRILGGMQFVYRKIASAADAMRLGKSAREATAEAGVFPNERAETGQYLEALGPRRRARLYDNFLAAQLAMRGVNSLDKDNRIVIERLLVQLAPPIADGPTSRKAVR